MVPFNEKARRPAKFERVTAFVREASLPVDRSFSLGGKLLGKRALRLVFPDLYCSNVASAGMPGFNSCSGLGSRTLMAKTVVARSSLVCMLRGVNSAFEEI